MQFISILPIDRTLSGATIPSQSGPGSNGNEWVLRIPQSPSIRGTSPSDCLVSYQDTRLGSPTPPQRCSRCILQPLLTGQLYICVECDKNYYEWHFKLDRKTHLGTQRFQERLQQNSISRSQFSTNHRFNLKYSMMLLNIHSKQQRKIVEFNIIFYHNPIKQRLRFFNTYLLI